MYFQITVVKVVIVIFSMETHLRSRRVLMCKNKEKGIFLDCREAREVCGAWKYELHVDRVSVMRFLAM